MARQEYQIWREGVWGNKVRETRKQIAVPFQYGATLDHSISHIYKPSYRIIPHPLPTDPYILKLSINHNVQYEWFDEIFRQTLIRYITESSEINVLPR